MPTDIYTFRPKPEVADWIDENINSWTNFCYDNIYLQQRKNYQERFERIGLRIFYILIGMIMISFIYLSTDIINYIFLLTGGIVIIIYGFFSLSIEVINGKRRRKRV